ncbi:MAG: DUF4332 domain-containing protein [Kamptonema sp. SIO1D9]|nr:DUF4332 domain-containing protein [Kamptonema sp. SIO1D9]
MKNTMRCYWSIEELPGLSAKERSLLASHKINTTQDLLAHASTAQQQELAADLQIHGQYVKKWVAMADLASISSVGCQYCGLILHAGIASVAQLAQTPVHRLHRQILRLQVATMQRKDLCPSVDEVQKWVEEAARSRRELLK